MPTFYEEVEIDIDVYEFIDGCSSRELKRLIKELEKRGLAFSTTNENGLVKNHNIHDVFWIEKVSKIMESRLILSQEDEKIISDIADKL